MEEKIFPMPAVAGKLKQYFIEARLHCDGGPKEDENKRLEQELARSSANPYYVIVDPKTGKGLRKKAGLLTSKKFIELLLGRTDDGPPREFEQR